VLLLLSPQPAAFAAIHGRSALVGLVFRVWPVVRARGEHARTRPTREQIMAKLWFFFSGHALALILFMVSWSFQPSQCFAVLPSRNHTAQQGLMAMRKFGITQPAEV